MAAVVGEARFQKGLERAAAKAMRVAAGWLLTRMLQDVGHQTDVRKGPGSPVGTPPYRRTGKGQDSLMAEATTDGAAVGVAGIGVPVLGNNYMAMWDDENGRLGVQRSWLSRWKIYRPVLDQIIHGQMQAQLGRM